MSRRLSTVHRTALVAILGLLSIHLHAQGPYVLIDLGTLPGGSFSEALALNEAGQAVGRSSAGSGDDIGHATLWQHGRAINLGTLPGGIFSFAYDINNRGQIVGESSMSGGDCNPYPFTRCERAFLWEHGVMKDLGTLGGPISAAHAINERGDIAGMSYTAFGEVHAVLWRHGALIDLGALPGELEAWAVAINNSGQVVGISEGLTTRAFIWSHGVMRIVGSTDGSFSEAIDINDRGQVLGAGDVAGTRPPVIWYGPTTTVLGIEDAYSGRATGINNRGQAVGTLTYLPNEDRIPVLWDYGTIVRLPTAVPPPNYPIDGLPSDINNHGVIAGSTGGHAALWVRH